jgi:serine/threonine protein kinase
MDMLREMPTPPTSAPTTPTLTSFNNNEINQTLGEAQFPLPLSNPSSPPSITNTKGKKPSSVPILTRRGHSSPVRPATQRRTRPSKATTLDVDDSVVLPRYGPVMRGFVRYIGPVHFATGGGWVGVELLDPERLTKLRHTAPDKKLHDGSVGGVRYFQAEHRRSSLFVRRSECLVTSKHGRRMLGKQKYKSMAVMKNRTRGGVSNNSNGDSMMQSNESTVFERQFSLSSSLTFRRTKSNDTWASEGSDKKIGSSARNSDNFEEIRNNNSTVGIQTPPLGGRRRSNSWSGESEEKAKRVWSDSMVFDNQDESGEHPFDKGNLAKDKINNNEDVSTEISHSMDLDLVTLKNMVDSLTSDRDEAVHHLEAVERSMEEEREKYRKDLKERDDEITHLRHMVRQQYTLELPLPPNSPAALTLSMAVGEVPTDTLPTSIEDTENELKDDDSSESDVEIARTNKKRPSLWARRRKSSTGGAFLLRVMEDTTISPTTMITSKDQGQKISEITLTTLPMPLRPPTIITEEETPKPVVKKTARNSMRHLHLDSVEDEDNNNNGMVNGLSLAGDATQDDGVEYRGHHLRVPSETVEFTANRLKTRGFEIDAFGLVSTPRGDYKRTERTDSGNGRDGVASSGSAEDDLLRLGYLGRGAGGVVYKALHLPTLRLCAVKVVPVHDRQHREQLVSEMKALRQNLVTWGNAQHDTCAGCGKAEHELTKTKAGTSRTCLLCAKFFCGSCKKIFMDKTKKHHTWKCKDDCEVMMFEDSKKVAAVALGSYLDHASSRVGSKGGKQNKTSRSLPYSASPESQHGKSPIARISHGLSSMFHSKSSNSGGSSGSNGATAKTTTGSSRIVELGITEEVHNGIMSPRSLQPSGRKMIDELRDKLSKWNEGGMTPEQTYLTRQLILSAVAEERGARCPFMVELYNVFYTDQRVSIVMELMDGGSLQDRLDDEITAREEEEEHNRRVRESNNFAFDGRSTIDHVVHHVRTSIVDALTSPLSSTHSRNSSYHNNIPTKNRPILDLPTLRNVARQALRGLALLHRQHRMHRDIKPANILMSRSGGQIKLADFGIAAEGEHAATEFTEFVGTLLYMAPERLKGSATYGFEADIWSFGLTVYACVVGEPPHKRLSQFELITTVVNDKPPRLDPSVYPADVCDFVALCLQTVPSNRPTAKQLLKHPFLKVGEKTVNEVLRRKSQQYVVGSPASKLAQQRLDDVLEHLYEYYVSMFQQNVDGNPLDMVSFEENSVRSLAQQLGVWPQTAVRKFDKLELKLRRSRLAAIEEQQHTANNLLISDDATDEESSYMTSQERNSIIGTTEWSEDVHLTLPPMGKRRTSRAIDAVTMPLDSSRVSLLSIDGDALDL